MMTSSREQRIELVRFALVAIAIVLLGYGAWLHYAPLGYMIGGAVLLIVVLIGMWRAR